MTEVRQGGCFLVSIVVAICNGHCVNVFFSFQCYGLNQHFDYDVSKPPTILFRHQNGQIAQTNDGKLVITPGAIVHMECLSIR